jgi:hypothetical protein
MPVDVFFEDRVHWVTVNVRRGSNNVAPATLVFYITRDGHSRELASRIGERLKAPVHEIQDLVRRKGFIGYLRSGAQASMKMATPIAETGVELKGVRLVVLVQPVWAASLCPPLRSWLIANRAHLRWARLALLVSCQVSPPERIQAKYDSEFGQTFGPLAALAVVHQKLPEPEKTRIIDDFAAALQKA